jgi:hypothetical protein
VKYHGETPLNKEYTLKYEGQECVKLVLLGIGTLMEGENEEGKGE